MKKELDNNSVLKHSLLIWFICLIISTIFILTISSIVGYVIQIVK